MLEARSISFSYGDRSLYEGFNFAVSPGERVALSAPSGFGKTTLCRILSGYAKPSSGQVLADGAPLPKRGACPVQMIWQHPETAVDPRMRMRKVLAETAGSCPKSMGGQGFSPQDGAQRELARLMEAFGIKPQWLDRYPHELSGGELQRFCIVRALALHPRYLIADEMSTMLDALTQARIWAALLEELESSGAGLVFVSHSTALTDRIATRVERLSGN